MSSCNEHLDMKDFDEDEELSDDEVFTRGGKSILLEGNGVNKPLMAPRHRTKDGIKTRVRKVPPIRVIWAPAIYFLITLSAVIGIISLVVFLINVFMRNVTKANSVNVISESKKFQQCSNIKTEDMWVRTFPKLTTETAIRLVDVNSDGIEDIILGFGTGADAFYYPPVVCSVYFPDSHDGCGGGALALDGKTGAELWRHYAPHEIFALNCNIDLDQDGIKDCVGGGRMAVFRALSGKDGKLLWNFDDAHVKIETSNIYTPQFVPDINFDGIPDLVAIHGGDPMKKPNSKTRLIGRLVILSGKTGQVLQWVSVPDSRESYYSPQVLMHPDGTAIVLFGTGGETHGGSLWCVKLKHLIKGDIQKAKNIYRDDNKGIMTPPVLIDITGDGVLDIVMAMFNSTVVAFNGLTFARIWAYQQQPSESYSTPGLTTVLDGHNGLPLLKKPIKMLVGTQSSPLTISVEGQGNDIFLYWISDCHGSLNETNLEFGFVKGTSVHEQSRADFCKLRFEKKLFTRLYALTSEMSTPGFVVYDSDKRKEVEYSNPINYSMLGLEFLYRNPKYQEEYEHYLGIDNAQLYDYTNPQDTEIPYEDYPLQAPLSYPRSSNYRNPLQSSQNPVDYYPENRPSEAQYYPSYYPGQKYQNSDNYYYPQEQYNPRPRNDQVVPRKSWPNRNPAWPSNKNGPKFYKHAPNYRNNFQNQLLRQHLHRQKKMPIEDYQPAMQGRSENAAPEIAMKKRHVGPHDAGGVQRVISTGTLVPPLNNKSGIDVVFATFWFYPSDVESLKPSDKECIAQRMKGEEERFKPTSEYYGLDHDAYEEMATEECLKNSRSQNGDQPNFNEYNPFNRSMGQMTVYRLHLDCTCPKKGENGQECSKILPFNQQIWSGYMGRFGNCVAMPRL